MNEQNDVGYVNAPSSKEIERAWKHVVRSTRTEVKDWLALRIYGHPAHTSKYLAQVMEKLQKREYKPANAYPFYIPKKDRSLRRFEFLAMDDRIVFQYLCNRLIKCSYKKIAELYSARRIFGNIPIDPEKQSDWLFLPPFNRRRGGRIVENGQYDLFRQRVLLSFDKFVRHKRQGWLIRTDIRSFYYSVDHNQLFKLIENNDWLPDKADRDLLRKCLEKWTPELGKGIPVGYECSDYIGNLYLNSLDEILKGFRAHRYVDDTYIFVQDFEQAKEVLFKIDKSLKALGLQRNTSKTKTYRIHSLPRKDLVRILRESLSTVADERQDAVAEAKRQDKLRVILQKSFELKRADEAPDDSFADFRNVAFVLNRITHQEVNIVEAAYYVLDHDLEHSYHALKYLSVYAPGDRLTKKLKSILRADYEPRSLKALAIYCLQKTHAPGVEDWVQPIVDRRDKNDWHLIRSILKQVVEPSLGEFSKELLDSAAESENPHTEVYARGLIFDRTADLSEKGKLVSDMLMNCNNHVKKLGIYFAHRDRLLHTADVSTLEPNLRRLFPEPRLNEIENFRNQFSQVFGISIDREFPIGSYFGNFSDIAQYMREIYASHNSDATKFVRKMHDLVSSMVITAAGESYDERRGLTLNESLDLFDDNEMRGLVAELHDETVKKYVRVERKKNLSSRFTDVFSLHVDNWHKREGLRVRNIMFISYSVADKAWCEMLVTAIKAHFGPEPPLWYFEGNLKFSDSIKREICHNRSITKVAILLTSNKYFASDVIRDLEYLYFKQQRDQNDLKILWIPCEPSSAESHGLGDVWTPAGIQPLSGKNDHDSKEAFNLAARKLFNYFNQSVSSAGQE